MADPSPDRPGGLGERAGGLLAWGIGLATFLAAWQASLAMGWVAPELLPPVADVMAAAFGLLHNPTFLRHAGVTLAQVAVAFAVAVPLGIALGIAIAESTYWSRVLKPIVFIAFAIPKSIFLPVFILTLGVNFAQKVGFGVFSAIFVLLIGAFAALDGVKLDHVRVARAYGASPLQIARHVYLPAMAPVLLEAARLAMIFNVTGILLAEMYASRIGVGQLIAGWGENFMLRELLAGILLVGAAAIAANEAIRLLERRVGHWRA